MNQQAIENKFNEMFKGASEFSYWRKGYNDCKAKRSPRMSDEQYLKGYRERFNEGKNNE